MAYQFYSYIIPTGLCTCIRQKTYAGMFPAVLLAIAPNWKGFKCSSAVECKNTLCSAHTMGYYTAIRKSELSCKYNVTEPDKPEIKKWMLYEYLHIAWTEAELISYLKPGYWLVLGRAGSAGVGHKEATCNALFLDLGAGYVGVFLKI